jgi:UDP-glucose 4-epimerase
VNKVDVVYHLGAAVGPRLIVEEPVRTIVTNLEGSEIVLDHCARFGKRVLMASTSEVYGDHRTTEPLHENARRVYGPTTQKRWLYADSKAMDEYLALAYRQERNLEFVIARLFNTVGPRQSGQYGMVVARFVQAAVAGAPLEIHGDGNQTRTFCHVQDTIRALQSLMESPATTGEIYNVGSKNWITIADLAQRVLELTGSRSEIVYVPYDQVYGGGIDDMLHRLPAIEKIAAAIGWQPERALDEILTDVIAFARGAAASPA